MKPKKSRHDSSSEESEESEVSQKSSSSDSDSEDSSASERRHKKKRKHAETSESDSDSGDQKRSRKRKHKKKKKKHSKKKRREESGDESDSVASHSEGEISKKKRKHKHKHKSHKRGRSASPSVEEISDDEPIEERRLQSVVKENNRRAGSAEPNAPSRTYYQKEYREAGSGDDYDSLREAQRFYRGTSKERRYVPPRQQEPYERDGRYNRYQQEKYNKNQERYQGPNSNYNDGQEFQRKPRQFDDRRPRYPEHQPPNQEYRGRPRQDDNYSRETPNGPPRGGYYNRFNNQFEQHGGLRRPQGFVDNREYRDRRGGPPEQLRYPGREYPDKRERYNDDNYNGDRGSDRAQRRERPPPPPGRPERPAPQQPQRELSLSPAEERVREYRGRPDREPTRERPEPTRERPEPTRERPEPTRERPEPTRERPQPTRERPDPTRERPKEDRPRGDRPRDDLSRPREDRPKVDRPREERPREERPREERPRVERQREEKPREERPREEKFRPSREQDGDRRERVREVKQERSSPKPKERRSRFAKAEEGGDYEWGKADVKDEEDKAEKEKPNFGLSGKLTADANTVNGVVVKYTEPDDAKQPKRRWRFYPFKGDKALPILYIHRQSAFLMGRDKKVADIHLEHPSVSKQHAALQFRATPFTRPDGTQGRRVRPYVIDLESANGTFVNNVRVEARRYVELLERDVVKFGFSAREYVLLHENSKDDAQDDDNQETCTTAASVLGANVTTVETLKQEKRAKLAEREDGA